MTIGGIILPEQYTPLNCTKPRAYRTIAVENTYGGVAIFDWGNLLAGKEIQLVWKSMTVALFDSLDAIYQAGAVVLWDSGINEEIFSVKIISFDGALLFDKKNEYMLDVTMRLLLLAKVVH